MTTQQSSPRTWRPDVRSHDIEKYGSGYLRVRNAITEYPTMSFDYRESGDGYFVRLEYNEQRTETIPKSSPKTADLIVDLIRQNPKISTSIIGEHLGISKRAVLKQTQTLKKAGCLRYVGPARGGIGRFWAAENGLNP